MNVIMYSLKQFFVKVIFNKKKKIFLQATYIVFEKKNTPASILKFRKQSRDFKRKERTEHEKILGPINLIVVMTITLRSNSDTWELGRETIMSLTIYFSPNMS